MSGKVVTVPKICFMPMNETYEVPVGTTVLDVALEKGIPMQHACGGFCACATCEVRVQTDPKALSTMDDEENERLDESATDRKPESRLGCQSKIQSDVTVLVVNQE